MERRDLDEQDADHQRHHHLEVWCDVVRQQTRRVRAWPPGSEAHAGQHRLDVQLVGRSLERDVARREPHVAVAGLRLPPRLVAPVRLEEASPEMVDRRPAHVLDEVALHVFRLQQPDVGAVALDRADARKRRHQRLGHTGADQEAGLVDARVRPFPPLERRVDQLGGEARAVLRAPRLDGGTAEPCAGRDVAPVGVEAPVATHAAGHERFGDRHVRQELALAVVHLRRRHGHSSPHVGHPVVSPAPPPECLLHGVYFHVYRSRANSSRVPSGVPPSSAVQPGPLPRPASPTRQWTMSRRRAG